VTLLVDGAPHRLRVQAGEGFVGQWDRRTWDRPMEAERDYVWRAKVTGLEPGYIKRDRIGWYTTHMHSLEGNEPYAYGYAFLYALSLPPGARTVRLPEAPGVRVYAGTACRDMRSAEPATALYDELP
jgi:alpha-mannosidase